MSGNLLGYLVNDFGRLNKRNIIRDPEQLHRGRYEIQSYSEGSLQRYEGEVAPLAFRTSSEKGLSAEVAILVARAENALGRDVYFKSVSEGVTKPKMVRLREANARVERAR